MAHSIVFDTLAYAKKLIAAGVPEKQAEVQAEALIEIVDENLATKRDLREMELSLKRDISEMEYRMKAGIIKWVAGMLVAQAAVLAAVIKLL